MNKRLLYISLFLAAGPCAFWGYTTYISHYQQQSLCLETFYGPMTVTEPVIIDLINHQAMQRLKEVNQYGVCHYFNDRNYGVYNRYQHSIGVFALLRKFGAPLKEQISGLLHDASHTVFSHVGDHVFKHNSFASSYQDDIHSWYLTESGLGAVLEKHGFKVAEILHKKGYFSALESNLPDICADRLEYNLQGGVLQNLITMNDVNAILHNISFTNNQWIFHDAKLARTFANISLYLTEYQWGSLSNQVSYEWTAQALRRMLDIGELTTHDIHFGVDAVVWDKMQHSSDPHVVELTHKIVHNSRYYQQRSTNPDLVTKAKFRGIDPLVQTQDGVKRLTEIDKDYAQEYHQLKKVMSKGWSVAFVDQYNLIADKQTTQALA